MKKTMIRRLAALLLCCLLLPCALTSCGPEKVMQSDGKSIDADLYRYWMITFKAYFQSQFADIDGSDESWNQPTTDGRTAAEYVADYTRNFAENALCVLSLCDRYGLSLSEAKEQEISDYIDEIVTYQFDGVRSDFAAELKKTYGITIAKLREAYEIEAKFTLLREYLFGENGPLKVSDDALDEYYRENYLHFQFIYINTEFKYDLDEKGNYKTDPATGYYLTPALTDEERAEKLARLDEAKARIESGEAFADVAAAYGEFDTASLAPEGFYLRRSAYADLSAAGYSAAVLKALFAMQPGEVLTMTERDMNTNYPGSFLLLSLPLGDAPYQNGADATKEQFSDMREQVETAAFEDLLRETRAKIETNEELLKAYTVFNVPNGLSYLK